MSNFILWPHRVHLRQLKTGLCILLTKTVDLFLVLLVFKCFCYIWLPNDGWGGKTVGRNIACLNHCTWSLLLYLQPINKLTSQCEIRTLWTELTTNDRGLSFDMSTRCIDKSMHKKTSRQTHNWFWRSQKFWGGGTNIFRPWPIEILAGDLHTQFL